MAVTLNKVFISDAVDPACVQLLESCGIQVTCKYKLPKEQLMQELRGYDGLIVRSDTKVTADLLAAAPTIRIVGRAGTGVDNIDIPAATRKGVIVVNTPGGNSISACEMSCALITCLARNVAQACQTLREGRWDRKHYTGTELYGKTLAVLGLGRIGREVAIRMQAFGMKTVGYDPMVSADVARQYNVQKMELEEIWPIADYITVHTPLIPQTRNLINEEVLNKCKRGVRIVNCARGGIVDEAALLEALKDGRCGGAAIDVFCEEPPKSVTTLELICHPAVIATPHLGASTIEAQQRVAVEIAEQFIALAINCNSDLRDRYCASGIVNAPMLAAAMIEENTPWITLAKELGKLASKMIQGSISETKVTITTSGAGMEKRPFLGTAVLVGMLTGRTKNGLNFINAPALAVEAGIKIDEKHNEEETNVNCVSVTVSQKKGPMHTVQGTVRGDDLPYLLAIDDASLRPAGLLLADNILLFQGKDSAENLTAIITQLTTNGANIISIVTATGKDFWVAVRTANLQDHQFSIPGMNCY